MSSNKVVLTSSDGVSFEVEEVVARKLQIVAHIIEDECEILDAIPLQNVTGEILAMVIEYCKKHVDADDSTEAEEEAKKKLEEWDADFMKNLDLNKIFSLVMAANYLNVSDLLDLASQVVADYIKDKTVEEVRDIFNIENDYTLEEEAAVRKEHAWAFDAEQPSLSS